MSMQQQHLPLLSIKGEKLYVVLIRPLNDDADESGIDNSRAPSAVSSGFRKVLVHHPKGTTAIRSNEFPSLFPFPASRESPGLFSLGTRGKSRPVLPQRRPYVGPAWTIDTINASTYVVGWGELVIVTGLFVAQQRQRLADALWHSSGRKAPERHRRKSHSSVWGSGLSRGEYGLNALEGILSSAVSTGGLLHVYGSSITLLYGYKAKHSVGATTK